MFGVVARNLREFIPLQLNSLPASADSQAARPESGMQTSIHP